MERLRRLTETVRLRVKAAGCIPRRFLLLPAVNVLIYFPAMRLIAILFLALLFVFGCASPPEPIPDDVPGELPDGPPVLDPTEETYERISAAMALGDPLEAIAAYESSQLEDPDSPQTMILLGNLYLAAGDAASAEEVFQDVLEADPENGDALFGLALIAGARDDSAQERDLLERAVEADPDNTNARAALGEIYLQARRYSHAEQAFTETLQKDPNHLVALIGLGNVRLRTEKPEEAESVLTRAIEVAPEYSFAYADRSRAMSLQYRLDAAEEDLATAIELDEDYLWHRYDRGLVRLERNNWSGAVEDFSAFISGYPDIFLAYVHRGRAYSAGGDRAAAIADFKTALSIRKDYHPGFQPYAMLLFEDEQYEGAADFFHRAWSEGDPADPRDPALVLLSALSWKLADEENRANRLIERAAGDLPQNTLYYEMARYYLRSVSGRRSQDTRILRAVEDESDRALQIRMKFLLAGQFEADGRTSSAVALYREVMETDLRGLPEIRLAGARFDALVGAP